MKYICPLITVSDIKVSRHFYENILKLKVKFDYVENITFEGDFAIHLDSHFKKLIDNKTIIKESNSFELYFEADELETLVMQLKTEKIDFVHELREQPWRQFVVRIYDPDKNIIEIGESMEHLCYRLSKEGLTVEHISRLTYLPVKDVNAFITNFKE